MQKSNIKMTMKNLKFWILILGFLGILSPRWAMAQATQFYLEDDLNPKWKARIYLVGDVAAKAQIQEALYHAVDHAREALKKLDSDNPSGELGSINQKKTRGSFMVSAELAKAIQAALDVARQTNGAFDIVAGEEAVNFRNIKVNIKNNELTIKKEGVTLNLRPILRGFLADMIADDLDQSGWKNCFVKVEDVYVARGNDVKGPWKFPVATPTNKLAKRVLFYKVNENASAGTVESNAKSVTVFTESAAQAEGLATALHTMEFEEGKKFLAKHTKLRGIFVDSEGNFTHIPEFKPNP